MQDEPYLFTSLDRPSAALYMYTFSCSLYLSPLFFLSFCRLFSTLVAAFCSQLGYPVCFCFLLLFSFCLVLVIFTFLSQHLFFSSLHTFYPSLVTRFQQSVLWARQPPKEHHDTGHKDVDILTVSITIEQQIKSAQLLSRTSLLPLLHRNITTSLYYDSSVATRFPVRGPVLRTGSNIIDKQVSYDRPKEDRAHALLQRLGHGQRRSRPHLTIPAPLLHEPAARDPYPDRQAAHLS